LERVVPTCRGIFEGNQTYFTRDFNSYSLISVLAPVGSAANYLPFKADSSPSGRSWFDSATYYQKQRPPQEVAVFVLERVGGIEPPSSVWKTEIITIIRYPHVVHDHCLRFRLPLVALTSTWSVLYYLFTDGALPIGDSANWQS
jgi:hypothetical protein